MRISSSSAAGHLDSDLHATGGGKKGSRAPGEHDDHGQSHGAGAPLNGGASGPDADSQAAAMQQAFNVALGAVAMQFVSSAMGRFDDAMAETEEDS
ncbi:nodulation protein NopC [Bradyrhizobium elkanii USDA 61]|jgi:hypothetical protein|uniref:NopC protein n=1 Tax=Bradyrhizobium elkanii TaxID=29448 RepID=C4PL71_BRAEL|nr:nodulation protein NopC [Bradyrhizobium elkanii USDA 61]GEC57389.1 nodulation protein NopC [Bradyrhizobium elkanii]CAQ57566.1 NopC protein [Bradyrhizobium elkanii]